MSPLNTPSHAETLHRPFDLLVVGGGVNGCGIARDAAGRGARVLLVEKDDLAGHTSSASTKLIHGGLRYLEHYAFRLVRESLIERERLLAIAPHIIWPMRFVLPHSKLVRPAWMLRAGLFLYDHLCPNMTLPRTRRLNLRRNPVGAPLKDSFTLGFAYSDGWVQDSRLVVLNAMDAAARGATVLTRTRLVSATRGPQTWEAVLTDTETGETRTVTARAMVNAAGPWVAELLAERLHVPSRSAVRLIKGSHIVVPRLFDGQQAYILQNPDKRIVFVIPYETAFTLIGTTDVPYEQDPDHVEITAEETRYLCDSVNRYFDRQVSPDDVVWSYAGVRPLYDDHSGDASAVTRDYVLDLDTEAAPILSVFGGKITTFRKLAEHALEKLQPHVAALAGQPGWTDTQPLPGGAFARDEFKALVQRLQDQAPHLDTYTAWRLVRNYGTRAFTIATPDAQAMGERFGATLTAREVDYLLEHEWARSAEDVLWRRSRLGLSMPDEAAARLRSHIAGRLAGSSPAQPVSTRQGWDASSFRLEKKTRKSFATWLRRFPARFRDQTIANLFASRADRQAASSPDVKRQANESLQDQKTARTAHNSL
ncbi:glycerol-3-phosphate dehydrogenase [Acidomonas methanolica]|nr:glycerol-3-phosphate dehydrogenase [Acidomonas methanolica]MBU2655148.1 glycerol-3-phosphate dehydrogenase [Acidomonas methanolica]TCS25185.1 homodimeric glycerol 3-phosphate dehydrogenase (quinone) [Acidomonas methanolica]